MPSEKIVSNDPQSLESLTLSINASLSLLKEYLPEKKINNMLELPSTLLKDSLKICQTQDTSIIKQPIRIVRHFACTGGTIISKCISAMPNIVLLSELSPLTTIHLSKGKPQFSPTDFIRQMKQGGFRSNIDTAMIEVFIAELTALQKYCTCHGQYPIIREHTHSHYCLDSYSHKQLTLYRSIEKKIHFISVTTVRDPVDSYLSLVKNKWVTFQPTTFDEYCKRYLLFLEDYSTIPIIKYEDFTESPYKTIQSLCEILEIPFSKNFQSLISSIQLTGDSGRSSSDIKKRSRREYSEEFLMECEKSKHYKKLCFLLNYSFIKR